MRPIKTITSVDPKFLDVISRFDTLVELHQDNRGIKVGEKFIRYYRDQWEVCKMSSERVPRLCGRFPSLHKAVWRAKLRV